MPRFVPRFGLRTFLIAITACCLLLGWRVAAVESVERPIRELERLGWQLEYSYPDIGVAKPGALISDTLQRPYRQKLFLGYGRHDLPNVAWFRAETEISAPNEVASRLSETVSRINRLPTISKLNLSGIELSKDCITPLARCQHVRILNLEMTNLNDSAVEHLATLTQLDYLILWDTKLTVEGVEELSKRLPLCEIQHDYNDD